MMGEPVFTPLDHALRAFTDQGAMQVLSGLSAKSVRGQSRSAFSRWSSVLVTRECVLTNFLSASRCCRYDQCKRGINAILSCLTPRPRKFSLNGSAPALRRYEGVEQRAYEYNERCRPSHFNWWGCWRTFLKLVSFLVGPKRRIFSYDHWIKLAQKNKYLCQFYSYYLK